MNRRFHLSVHKPEPYEDDPLGFFTHSSSFTYNELRLGSMLHVCFGFYDARQVDEPGDAAHENH
jgi:hypothetical protein